jgi:hypothetical protein
MMEQRRGFVGWWRKAKDEGLPLISFGNNTSYMYVDMPKRRSRCRICNGYIPVGDKRGVLVAKHGYARNFKGGGVSVAEQFLENEFAMLTFDAKSKCFDCERPFDGDFDFERRIWYNHGDYYVCQKCWDSPRWRVCDLCDRVLPKSATSVIVGYPGYWGPRDELSPVQYACSSCSENDGVTTARQARKMEAAEAVFNERYQRILLGLEQGDLFSGG